MDNQDDKWELMLEHAKSANGKVVNRTMEFSFPNKTHIEKRMGKQGKRQGFPRDSDSHCLRSGHGALHDGSKLVPSSRVR